ncbi:MAG: ATP-binding protein [Candidatus Omnitrophota bacterium]
MNTDSAKKNFYKRVCTPLSLFLILVSVIFFSEAVIMILLTYGFPQIEKKIMVFVDGILLIVLLFPALYFIFFKILRKEIEAREFAEEVCRASERRCWTLIETSPDCIKLFDDQGKLVFINKGGLEEHNLKDLEEALRWSYLDGIIEEDREVFKQAFQAARNGEIRTIEIRHTKEGSNRKVCLETMAPVLDENGKVNNVFGVSRDISDRKEFERMKDFLMNTIVHDIRGPLGVLKLIIESLKRELSEVRRGEKMQLATIKVNEIDLMLGNLLDLRRIEEGKVKLNFEEFDLGIFIDEVSQCFKVAGEDKKILVSGAASICIRGDKEFLRRTLMNLIGNALKFTPPGSEIEIEFYAEDERNVLIAVKDHGIGVPSEYREKIFDQFVKVKGSLSVESGSGLGLAFCKMAVNAHEGEIWVENREGGGSIFFIRLPKRKPSGQDVQENNH